MYIKPHIEVSGKGDNLSSCKKYATYLSKEAVSFFNHSSDNISLRDAIEMIDRHSKGQLNKNEAKWYAPVYSFSEKEAQFICYKLFGKLFFDYTDLSEKQKEIYNQYIIELGKSFQDVMAENFNKRELGIIDGSNLCYVGVVENSRVYKAYDEDVKAGIFKEGSPKKGFNTHIHIIQSRKANNEKKSKISPMQNSRKITVNNMGQKVGFDRINLKISIENKFDKITNYNRKIEDTFEYQNQKKKEKKVMRRPSLKRVFYDKNTAKEIKSSSNLRGYFFYLANSKKLEYKGKNKEDKDLFFNSSDNSLYIVDDTNYIKNNGWFKKDIFKAHSEFEELNYLYALNQMEQERGYKLYNESSLRFNKEEMDEFNVLSDNIGSLFKKK